MHAAPHKVMDTLDQVRNSKQSVSTYLEEVCDRVEAVNPEVKALLPEPDRRERLKDRGIELREKYTAADSRPPLYGIPIGVKDIIRINGFETRAGSNLPPEALDGTEAKVGKSLREAGGLILGKTVTAEFAYQAPGTTRNPHDLGHTPGGSSSGSAAAVAAGLCPLALGTQTGGSIIRPAAFCGVVGFKPSLGRIPTDGVIPLSESLDTIGIFTQDIAGMQFAASVLCTEWDEDISLEPAPVLGVPSDPYLQQASDIAIESFENHLRDLEESGYEIREVDLFEDIDELKERYQTLIAAEAALTHSDWFSEYRELYRRCTAELIRNGKDLQGGELAESRAERVALREKIDRVAAAANVDLFVSPAALGPAPEGLESTGDPSMNVPWSYAGVPALTLPVDEAPNGLPLGLQFTAPFMQDERLLAYGSELALTH